ncbi:hypothetical protein KBB89_03890 [Candidatus Gracilibacteria bacterium]|nr:hypothetical protein [Candidatus Gracilibacteria bacterium]
MSDIPTSEQIENEDARRHYPPHFTSLKEAINAAPPEYIEGASFLDAQGKVSYVLSQLPSKN